MHYRINVEVLENGFEVELPDIDAMDKADKAHKKDMKSPEPYMGNMYKKYAAKSVKEVLALVTPALKKLPQASYDEAFAEASAENSKHR